jgi:uncharacterized protein (TIGR00725 family)
MPTPRSRGPLVAVVGPGEADERCRAAACEAGRLIAEAGAVVLCGGLGGVMEAACRGAAAAGGTSIGLLPGSSAAAANEYVTVALPTGLGEMRNALLVRCADAVVAIGCSSGTVSEVALAARTATPVVWLHGPGADVLDVPRAESAEAAVRLVLPGPADAASTRRPAAGPHPARSVTERRNRWRTGFEPATTGTTTRGSTN